MNKKFCIHLGAVLVGMFALFSCKPPSESTDEGLGWSESNEETETSRQKPLSDGVIGSVADLKVELDEVAQGKDKSKVFESALAHSKKFDESAEAWDGTSTSLATQFSDFTRNGNPTDEFYEEFGLVGNGFKSQPQLEVEILVRTMNGLNYGRPDLLQQLLATKAQDASQGPSDLVVYASAQELVTEYQSVFRQIGYEKIRGLQESQNPIYRLLAAKLMPVLERDPHSLAEFYRPYVAEKDETILLAAIDGLTTSGTPEALVILREIASNNRDKSSQVVEFAERALELIAPRQAD